MGATAFLFCLQVTARSEQGLSRLWEGRAQSHTLALLLSGLPGCSCTVMAIGDT